MTFLNVIMLCILVLNDRWYDACANLPPSRYRRLGYALPNETFFYLPPPSLIVHKDSELELKDIAAPCNDLTIGKAWKTYKK